MIRTNAERLLKDHKVMMARRVVLKIVLGEAEAHKDSGQGRKNPPCVKPHKAYRSQDRTLGALVGRERQRLWAVDQASYDRLRTELADVERALAYYDAAIAQLTEKERLFVQLHYDERIPMTALANHSCGEWRYKGCSLSTLKRLKREIKDKVQRLLVF